MLATYKFQKHLLNAKIPIIMTALNVWCLTAVLILAARSEVIGSKSSPHGSVCTTGGEFELPTKWRRNKNCTAALPYARLVRNLMLAHKPELACLLTLGAF